MQWARISGRVHRRGTAPAARRPRRLARLAVWVLLAPLALAGCLPVAPQAGPSRSEPSPPAATPLTGLAIPPSGMSLPPMPFIENDGQVDPRVRFVGRAGAMTAYYGDGIVAYGLLGHDPERLTDADRAALGCAARHPRATPTRCPDQPPTQRWWLTHELVGAQTTPPVALEPAETVVSMLVPPGPHPGLRTYRRLAYESSWPGIDILVDHADAHTLETTYLLRPGAAPQQIHERWHGATAALAEDGALTLATPLGVLRERAPTAYQDRDGQRTAVPAHFVLMDAQDGPSEASSVDIGIEVGAYDPSFPLAIDPPIEYATFVGGDEIDEANAMAVDGSGRAYLAGTTGSMQVTFPDGDGFGAIPGADKTFNGNGDAFVVRLNASGTAFEYATYVGGDNGDEGLGLAVDSTGRAILVGDTLSHQTTFPDGDGFGPIPGFNHTFGGLNDGYALRLSADGQSIEFATYLGGTGFDEAQAVAVDTSGHVYVGGGTTSTESSFPGPGGFGSVPGVDHTENGNDDAFVVRLDGNGTVVGYATYLGGSEYEGVNGIAVDSTGRAVVTGTTTSTEATFPTGSGVGTIPGADKTFNGGQDAYVIRLSAAGTAIEYATYLGGTSLENGFAVALDSTGRAYVAGQTESTEATFPTGSGFGAIPGAVKTLHGLDDAFVVRLSATGTSIEYATYIGGAASDIGNAVAVDSTGRATVVGTADAGSSATFPNGTGFGSIPGADHTYNGGSTDGFVVRVAANGTTLDYASFLGGSGEDTPKGVGVDPNGRVLVGGFTTSTQTTFPNGDGFGTIPGAVRVSPGGLEDAFALRLSLDASCSPRPPVHVQTSRGVTGTLNVTVQAGQGAIARIDFGAPRAMVNSSVTVQGGPANQTSAFTFTPTGSPTTVQFTVSALNRALPTTAAFTVTDGCGTWTSFVGGGAGSF